MVWMVQMFSNWWPSKNKNAKGDGRLRVNLNMKRLGLVRVVRVAKQHLANGLNGPNVQQLATKENKKDARLKADWCTKRQEIVRIYHGVLMNSLTMKKPSLNRLPISPILSCFMLHGACGHSKRLKPTWQDLSSKYNNKEDPEYWLPKLIAQLNAHFVLLKTCQATPPWNFSNLVPIPIPECIGGVKKICQVW